MEQLIPQLHVGHGSNFGALSIFPVWVDAPRVGGLEWDPSCLTVDEREGSAVVGELVLTNRGPKPLVLLEGDLLRGGKQDRMLASSQVLAPRLTTVAPVYCVEQGRWTVTAQHIAEGRRSAYSVRCVNDDGQAQGRVWGQIERFESALGATESASMIDHIDRVERIALAPLDGQRGVIIGIGGHIVAAELFGSATGLRARWQGILDAAALDARLAPTIPTRAEQARSFARKLMRLHLERQDSRCDGSSPELRATGLAREAELVHLTAFSHAHPLLTGV